MEFAGVLKSHLERIGASLAQDLKGLSGRPVAPFDEWIQQAEAEKSPLLFKAFCDDLLPKLRQQANRAGLSDNTKAELEVAAGAIGEILSGLTVDLSTAIEPADILSYRENEKSDSGRSGDLERKLVAIERITGHLIAPPTRRFGFANWTENSPLNPRLFPENSRKKFCNSAELAALPIRASESVIWLRGVEGTVVLQWGQFLERPSIEELFANDCAVFSQTVNWLVCFCHGDYGLYAERDNRVNV